MMRLSSRIVHGSRFVALMVVFALFTPTVALAQDAPPPEDEGPGMVLGGIRWIPHAQVRLRSELRGNYPNVADDVLHFVTSRARLGLSAQWRILEVFIQMQDVRLWGEQSPIPFDNGTFFGLHQGYANIGGSMGFVRAGRQEINYGDQRMIGALNWLSAARSFDGLRLHGNFASGDLQIDAFGATTHLQTQVTDGTTVEQSEGSYLGTFYLTWRAAEAFAADVYTLYRHDGPTDANPALKQDIFAFGTRLTGGVGGLGYTAEVTVQSGDTDDPKSWDFFAWAASADVWFNFGGGWQPTLRAGFAAASGASGDTNEFNNFYPTNHKFYGVADLIGLRNLVEGHVRLKAGAPAAPVTFYAEFLQLALQTADGRWSSAPGATVAATFPDADRNLGSEVDLVAAWTPLPGIALSAGYSLFIPANGAEQRGISDLVHFGYLMLDLRTL